MQRGKSFGSTIAKGVAKELIGENIATNWVSPGLITTHFHDRYSTHAALARSDPQVQSAGRLGTPEDCVAACLFRSLERLSRYVVGQQLNQEAARAASRD